MIVDQNWLASKYHRTPLADIRGNGSLAKPSHEMAIQLIAAGLKMYADAHKARYDGDPIGTDSILRREWTDIATGVLGLLNGETGGLDCGTIDGAIRRLASANDVKDFE